MTHRLPTVAILVAALLSTALLAGAASAAPTLRTPGYKGVVKPVVTKPPTAPDPTKLSTNGVHPNVLVDAAGTAHIVWNEPSPDANTTPDVTVYCRLPRGAKQCDPEERLVPPLTSTDPGVFPGLSADSDGPKVVAVNDQVVVLSHRYPYPVPKPGDDGSNSDDTLYIWTSDDGGRNFVGPGVVGTASIGGGAAAFETPGSPGSPSLGVITGITTGGTAFVGLRPGTFTLCGGSTALSPCGRLASGDFSKGRLTVLDGKPAVAYQDGSTSFVQRWSGQGDPTDPATWDAPASFPGVDPAIAAAGSRLLLLNNPDGAGSLVLRDVASGGAPVTITKGRAAGESEVVGFPDGTASVVWQGTDAAGVSGIFRQPRVTPGTAPSAAPGLISTAAVNSLSAAATDDAGGVVVGDTLSKEILLSAFGSRAATGVPGLGSLNGGGEGGGAGPGPLPPGTVVDCQKVRFGAVEALLQDGCFLNAATGGSKVTEGTLRLNGLEIIPSAGVQVLIDPRKRTIDTTGTVSVILKAPGVPEITLFKGALHLKLADAGIGDSLFAFTKDIFQPSVLGFPVGGDVDVKLTDAGVKIPISLELPKVFGGVSGKAEIVADNTRGLMLDSLRFTAETVPLGPVLLRKLDVEYKATGGTSVGDCLRPPTSGASAQPNEWAGVFELELPPPNAGPKLCGSIRFGDGRFRAATFRIDLPYPGIVLFPGVSIISLGGGLSLEPLVVSATVRIGAVQATAQTAVVNLDGSITLKLEAPFTLIGQVAVRLAELQVGTAQLVISAAGYVSLKLGVGYDIGPFSVQGSISGFVDGPREQFSIAGDAQLCAGDQCVKAGEVVLSTKGVAVCGPPLPPPLPRGLGFKWSGTLPDDIDLWFLSCDADDYKVADTRLPAAREHESTPDATATVEAGATNVTFRVQGDGGVPSADLIAPNGAPVTPDVTYPDPDTGRLYLAVSQPAAGQWTVRAQPGSPLIAELATSRSTPPAKVESATVTGGGRGPRTLRYRTTIGSEQGVTFAERGAAGTRVLGPARAGRGTLGFTPGPGPGGRREIVALIERSGLVRHQVVVARYVAPAPPALGRVTALRLRRAGRSVLATWRPAANASAQLVTVTVSGSPSTSLQAARAARLVVPGARTGQTVVVKVVAVAASGRRSPPARATLRITR